MHVLNMSQISFRKDSKEFVSCMDMSSGEFNMLATIVSVASVAEKNVLVLMDEPEISLHLNWQQKLIETILELNPQCQHLR